MITKGVITVAATVTGCTTATAEAWGMAEEKDMGMAFMRWRSIHPRRWNCTAKIWAI
jgi:hypothetical protein